MIAVTLSRARNINITMHIGIDASNLRSGGTITHVVELLRHADPVAHGIDKVSLWASAEILKRVEPRPWLERVHVRALEGPLARRVAWQMFERRRLARTCDLVFAPGATVPDLSRPYVSMSANILPFDGEEMARYRWTRGWVKLHLLRRQQSHAFRSSAAVIFLTDFARSHIGSMAGLSAGAQTVVIPSGVSTWFHSEPRAARPLASYSEAHPFRFLYVSDVHPYKHQWNVVDAVVKLRRDGLPISLDLIGAPVHGSSARRLRETLSSLNGHGRAIRFHGNLEHHTLAPIYREADAFVFASTCENLPMTLVEAMASGLPIAVANVRPMTDIAGDAAEYFDADDVDSIANALRNLTDAARRDVSARSAWDAAQAYSWKQCADRTFALLADVAGSHRTR